MDSKLETAWELEREIVISRVFDAPRELVFRVWTDSAHVGKWFGPRGFTCETQEINVAVGGRWRFVFIGPDGKRWDNRVTYLEVKAPERLVFDHGHDKDDDPEKFRVIITFDEQSNKKTVVTLRQLHPTKALRDTKIAFGAVELGLQTLDRFEEHLKSGAG